MVAPCKRGITPQGTWSCLLYTIGEGSHIFSGEPLSEQGIARCVSVFKSKLRYNREFNPFFQVLLCYL